MPIEPSPRSSEDMRRQEEAAAVLRRVQMDSAAIGGSSLAQHDRVETDPDDRIEVIGKRIGRILGGLAVMVILWQLVSVLFAAR